MVAGRDRNKERLGVEPQGPMSRKDRRKQASLGRGGQVVVAPEIAGGWRALQAKRLAEAEALARRVLARNAQDVDGLNLLGHVAIRAGHRDPGLDLIRRAVAAAPKRADLHFGLGQALQAAGKPAEAEAAYAAGLKLDPNAAAAHNDRGLILLALKRPAEAEAAFRHAYRLAPAEGAGILYNLGNALAAQSEHEKAIAEFAKAIALRPGIAVAHNNLGLSLLAIERHDEALAAFDEALRLAPANSGALVNSVKVLLVLGRAAEAEARAKEAIGLAPADPEAHFMLGLIHYNQNRKTEAEAAFRKSIALNPGAIESLSLLSNILRDSGRVGEAIQILRAATARRPDLPIIHSNLLLGLNYASDANAAEVFAEHRRWAERHSDPLTRAAPALPARSAGRDRPLRVGPLRVGYVSPDFRTHSVSYFFEPLLTHHDPARIKTFCYADVAKPDATTDRLRALARHWRFTNKLSDERLAAAIRADDIDILVDLAGHTAGNRLLTFARRPAPVQVSWLGYPNTTGMQAMDYRITDAIADPPGDADRFHTEKLIRLENGFLCYRPPDDGPEVGPLPALSAGHVTFGSFNNLAKLTRQGIACWAAILNSVPGARLVLKAGPFIDAGVADRIRGAFAGQGVAADRLDLVAWDATTRDHLARYGQVDICLDPFPYNGTTTTCEALWMGVPVVTLCGDRHAARVGASILTRVGQDDLVASGIDDYVAKAVSLAGNLDRLATLRSALRGRVGASSLCDGTGFARSVETVFRSIRAGDSGRSC